MAADSGIDWAQIAQLSSQWANPHELTLAQEFVDRLDTLPDAETGTRSSSRSRRPTTQAKAPAAALTKELADKAFLGLQGPSRASRSSPRGRRSPAGSGFGATEATVQVISSDGLAAQVGPLRQVLAALGRRPTDKFEAAKFGDALAEGVLNRLVRAQLKRGPTVKGKPTYQVRIDNASPLVLNGLAGPGHRDDGRREAQAALRDLHLAAAEPDRAGHRGGRQDARPEEGHPRRRRRPQRTLRTIGSGRR